MKEYTTYNYYNQPLSNNGSPADALKQEEKYLVNAVFI